MSGAAFAFLAFALVLGTGVVWFRRAHAVNLPENRTGFVMAMVLGIAIGIAAMLSAPGWLGGVAASLAILAGGFFLFTVAISAQKGSSGAFALGQPVPDFTAPDENGEPFALASLAGRPFLLKFFRGHW